MPLKEKCSRCHKVKDTRKGDYVDSDNNLTLLRPPQALFLCFRCFNKWKHEKHDRFWVEMRAFIEEKRAKGPYFQEKNAMVEVLRKHCNIAGWYSIKEIAKLFKHAAGWRDEEDSRCVSKILNLLGFSQRKRLKRGSYMHVFVDPARLPLTGRNTTESGRSDPQFST
jgi:hypothetical protein